MDFLEEEGVLRGGRSGSDRGPEYGSRKLLASVELHCAPPHCSPRPGNTRPRTISPPRGDRPSSRNAPPFIPAWPGPAQPSCGLCKCPPLLLLGAPCPCPTRPSTDVSHARHPSLCAPVYRQAAWPASSANVDGLMRRSPATETKVAPAQSSLPLATRHLSSSHWSPLSPGWGLRQVGTNQRESSGFGERLSEMERFRRPPAHCELRGC